MDEIQPTVDDSLAEWSERLTANAKVATVLDPIPASSYLVEFLRGRQMKQYTKNHPVIQKNGLPPWSPRIPSTFLMFEPSSRFHRTNRASLQQLGSEPRVADPHWFLCGSRSSFLSQCLSGSKEQNHADPDSGQTLLLQKVGF